MNLLFFASDYKIGLSFLLTEELKFLIRQPGLNVYAIAGEKEQTVGLTQQIEDNRIPLTRVSGLDVHKKFLELGNKIYGIICEKEISVVHVQNNWQLSLLVFIKYYYKTNYKIVYTIHGYRHNSVIKSVIAKSLIDLTLFFFADVVLVSSTEVKQKFPLVRKKCSVLYLGVEDLFFNKQKIDFSNNHNNLIFAGQFRKGKNQSLILYALSKYVEKTGDKNFRLYLPGEGPLKEKCINLCKKLNLQDNVYFPGQLNREEILKLYRTCQIAVIPTNSETFGHCIAEPLVLGLCIITRRVGIATDVIKNGENGLIFKDSNDLSLILEKYLNTSDIAAFGNSAYEQREAFRWSTICDKYNKILQKKNNLNIVQSDIQNHKTNILFFASDYKIGLSCSLSGQARSVFELSGVNLFCIAGEKEQESGLSAKYVRFNIPLFRIAGLDDHKRFTHLSNKLGSVISDMQIDAIHIHNNWQLALVVYLKHIKGYKFKIIYSIHGYRHNYPVRAFFARKIIGLALFMFADLILAGSTELKKAIPFISKKSYLLFQGVEEDLFRIRYQAKFEGHINIIFAGQFRKGKNQKNLLLSFHDYSKKTGDFQYTLYLPGTGKLKQSCVDLSFKLGLANNVIYPGQLMREEIIALYEKCHIAIIPSNMETYGYCIAEPYVAGLCVISRKTGIAMDIIEHEKSGLLFNNVKDLEFILVKYLRDKNYLKFLARNSYQNREALRWCNIMKDYEILINKLF